MHGYTVICQVEVGSGKRIRGSGIRPSLTGELR